MKLFFKITFQDKMERLSILIINFDDSRCVNKLYFIMQLIFEDVLIFMFS